MAGSEKKGEGEGRHPCKPVAASADCSPSTAYPLAGANPFPLLLYLLDADGGGKRSPGEHDSAAVAAEINPLPTAPRPRRSARDRHTMMHLKEFSKQEL